MKTIRTILLMAFAMLAFAMPAKKVLDHDAFDDWKKLGVHQPSNDGEWAAFEAKAYLGDGYVTLRNTRNGRELTIPRGTNPSFTSDSRWAIVTIVPPYQDTRKAKIDGKKDFDMPQDSLAIVNLKTLAVEKIPNVISWKNGERGGDWIAWKSCDTTYIKPGDLKDKKSGKPLVVRHLPTGATKTLKWVKDFNFSKDGNKLAFNLVPAKSDSVAKTATGFMALPDTSYTILDFDKKLYGEPVFNETGSMLSFTATNDSTETGTRVMNLYKVDLAVANPVPQEVSVLKYGKNAGPNLALPHSSDPEEQAKLEREWSQAMAAARGPELFVNQYSKPRFSHDGRRLVIGVAPYVAPDDTTIVKFETADLDIWRWDAPMTPPEENHLVDEIRKNTYPVVINLASGDEVILASGLLEEVHPGNRYDADWVLVEDPTEEYVSHQWNYRAPSRLYVRNVNNGQERYIGNAPQNEADISPEGNYVIWFDGNAYQVYDIADKTTRNVSAAVPYALWDESWDKPMSPDSYGILGWEEGDKAVLVYDKYDIYSLDPKAQREPVCITAGEGRKTGRTYRYIKTDKEERSIKPGQELLLSVFDNADKRNGLATLKYSGSPKAPQLRTLEEQQFFAVRKAKDADVFVFGKANFNTSPDTWVSRGYDFAKAQKISDINPQMRDYTWGTAQLVKWTTYSGKESEGVLYVPEDFDPEKKYPMLAVFYETGSELLYGHYNMEPSWSWVNYPFYVSRGYVVFQPDIHYTAGVPGECAYDYVCSGVEELCKRYPWIDKERIGIDGQSWGGYQTAYLVTRTDMFACAGSGAPVANMTSAFGGIRWESGNSRQAQYEQGQSRIGRNLWEAPELYIANSPVFHANRVHTPLLIMHNDADGAVPWYQGIELFMALRRLNKPVWMLQYNGEAHNLREKKNRKDITIRLQQFFDHYLKGAPMPEWMKHGIPAIRKGQEMGTGLVE